MIDFANRFASDSNHLPDPYEEEAIAAFRLRAEEVIEQCREQHAHPVVLLVNAEARYAGCLVPKLIELESRGHAVEVPHFTVGARVFVVPHFLAIRLLQPLGRTVWGLDFDLHLRQRLEREEFDEVTLWDNKVRIRHCWPSHLVAA